MAVAVPSVRNANVIPTESGNGFYSYNHFRRLANPSVAGVVNTAAADTGWSVGTIADYFGVPTGVPGLSVSALPFRVLCLGHE